MDAAWTAQHQYGGALLGEHLGQLLVIGWSVTLCVIIVRTRVLPRWLGVTGLAVSALYLLNQGDIFATASPASRSGTCRADRQHRLGSLGSRPRRHHPPAPRNSGPPAPRNRNPATTAEPRS